MAARKYVSASSQCINEQVLCFFISDSKIELGTEPGHYHYVVKFGKK
jgi:hypothetical protein